jgi:hypothetical protein
MAIGGEFAHYGLEMNRTRPNNTGPSSRGSEAAFYLFLQRDVKSAYAELNIPLVGPGNEMPFIRRFDDQPVGPGRQLQRDRHHHQSAHRARPGSRRGASASAAIIRGPSSRRSSPASATSRATASPAFRAMARRRARSSSPSPIIRSRRSFPAAMRRGR